MIGDEIEIKKKVRLFASDNFVPVFSIDFLVEFSTFSSRERALLAFRPATSLQLNRPSIREGRDDRTAEFRARPGKKRGASVVRQDRRVEGSRRRVCVRKRLHDRCQINTSRKLHN